MPSLVSPQCLTLSLSLSPARARSSFSPGILCILSVLCNASPQRRQAGSSVFLLHRSAAGLLCKAQEREGEYVSRVCVCVCVSVSLAVLCCHGNARHMAHTALQPSAARVVLQEASLSL